MTEGIELPPVTLRGATPADCEIIARMIMELAIYERAPEQCFATAERVSEQLFGARPSAECLLAECGGKVAAFALFFQNFSSWECAPGLYLEDLFVRPAYRRRGIGTLLLERLAAIALERGCKRFEWIVLDWNKPAIDTYVRIGAKPLDDWTVYRLDGDALAAMARRGRAPAASDPPAPEVTKPRVRRKLSAAGGGQPDLFAADHKPAPAPPKPQPEPQAVEGKQPARVVVYTDGGASPNPGVGAWAAILVSDGRRRELVGGELGTTNNRMELSAAIGALEALGPRCDVELHTDSQYVKNGITSWIKGWKRNGWMRGRGREAAPVKNADLWRRLDALCQEHNVTWSWVRGHAGNRDNERADELCTAEIERLTRGSTPAQRREALAAEARRQAAEQGGG
jgi:ribonuclease HI